MAGRGPDLIWPVIASELAALRMEQHHWSKSQRADSLSVLLCEATISVKHAWHWAERHLKSPQRAGCCGEGCVCLCKGAILRAWSRSTQQSSVSLLLLAACCFSQRHFANECRVLAPCKRRINTDVCVCVCVCACLREDSKTKWMKELPFYWWLLNGFWAAHRELSTWLWLEEENERESEGRKTLRETEKKNEWMRFCMKSWLIYMKLHDSSTSLPVTTLTVC